MKHCISERTFTTTFRGKQVQVHSRIFELLEDTDPADHFEFQEDVENVRSGKHGWCCLKADVRLSYNGRLLSLGFDYLGCVSYDGLEDLKNVAKEHGMEATALEVALKQAEDTFQLFLKFNGGANG